MENWLTTMNHENGENTNDILFIVRFLRHFFIKRRSLRGMDGRITITQSFFLLFCFWKIQIRKNGTEFFYTPTILKSHLIIGIDLRYFYYDLKL